MYRYLNIIFISLIFSAIISFSCKKNKAPDIPSTPVGPTSGSINIEYTFTSSAEDPDNDSVAIRFDWGDSDTSDWSKWKASGESISMSHSWLDYGTYNIKTQAKDKKDITSEWSEGHQIVISVGWIKTFGGLSDDNGTSVQQTTDGGYIITGYTNSLDYGADDYDVLLIKTDASGNKQWDKIYGGYSTEQGYSVEQTSDGGYVIIGETWSYGYGSGFCDVYLIKTNAKGTQQWYKTFGGSNVDKGYSVQQTLDGGYIITGFTRSYVPGSDVVYLIKTDVNGNEQWYKTFGVNCGNSVQQTSDSGYIILGYTARAFNLIKTDADGNQTWLKTYGGSGRDRGYSCQQTLDGGYIITGYTCSYGAGESDVYLIKTDASGNEQWYNTFGGLEGDVGSSVQQTLDGGYIITGRTQSYGAGEEDVYLIKTDANGNQTWDKTFGGSSEDNGNSVKQTIDGGYIITGFTRSFEYGAELYDIFLIKTDANGNVE